MKRAWSISLTAMMMALPVGASGAEQPAPPTACPAASVTHDWARHGADPKTIGVPLLFGMTSGMTRAEVKTLDPRLTRSYGAAGFDLFPGVPVKAEADFDQRGKLSSVLLFGISRADTIAAALTAHYGRPQPTGPTGHFLDIPIPVSGGTRWIENHEMRWCDSGRQFVLRGERDYWLTVSPLER
jgi:hypothetical protein